MNIGDWTGFDVFAICYAVLLAIVILTITFGEENDDDYDD